jgi:D-alanyl-D-alanine carboxypeptidase/D-alanyl-D-alanine-endopeptidase (penicillin-binding protein 4)
MKTFFTLIIILISYPIKGQINPAIEKFLKPAYMQGASVSIMAKDIKTGKVLFSYDPERELIPASVMKVVTTAVALEILGENYRFETTILYDGQIQDSTLTGNIYIKGSGDPTLGSKDAGTNRDYYINEWVAAIKKAGIRKVNGSVISDESIFDTEGISMKWMREDLGSYYGQGCYGLNVFDNRYSLFINSGAENSKPEISKTDPGLYSMTFHNYLTSKQISTDSTYIIGFPYTNERYLYGVIPANKTNYKLVGDIPEPALFLAQYLTRKLNDESISVSGEPCCYRILSQQGKRVAGNRKFITSSYSLPLKKIVEIMNFTSSNLYADALLKTIGLKYRTEDIISSFDKGIFVLNNHLNSKGVKTSSLWMFDGSGLAATDKVTASFLCDLLSYMATKSDVSEAFINSIPRAGKEGTVKNTLNGSALNGKIRLKSGSMSRVRCYTGYVTKGDNRYAVAVLVNNFSCKPHQIKNDIETLFLSLFK